MKEILNDSVMNMNNSRLEDNGSISFGDLTGRYIRNIINNICSNDGIRYLEIGLYRGGIFSSALFKNKIIATGIDNWSQNWQNDDPKEVFFKRVLEVIDDNEVDIIEADCWESNLLTNRKYNVYTFDGPHGYQDQYDALAKYYDNLDDVFIYIVDDYDNNKSPEVVKAVQDSISDLKLNKLCEHYFGASSGFHEGVYFCCLEKSK